MVLPLEMILSASCIVLQCGQNEDCRVQTGRLAILLDDHIPVLVCEIGAWGASRPRGWRSRSRQLPPRGTWQRDHEPIRIRKASRRSSNANARLEIEGMERHCLKSVAITRAGLSRKKNRGPCPLPPTNVMMSMQAVSRSTVTVQGTL